MKAEVTDPNTNANIINATDIPMVSPVTRSFSASSAKVCSIVAVPIKKNSNSLLEKSSVMWTRGPTYSLLTNGACIITVVESSEGITW